MHVHDLSDSELVTLLSRGDGSAFEAIYRRYTADLFRFARKNISAREDCEEIIQEVFESLWARRKSIQIETSIRFYLFGMVRYKIIHYFKSSSKTSTFKQKYAEHYLLFEAAYDNLNGESFDSSAIEALIEKSIGELPERCQVALKLRLHENLSNTDIAKRMNVKKTTVEMYMFRAVSHLRSTVKTSKPAPPVTISVLRSL